MFPFPPGLFPGVPGLSAAPSFAPSFAPPAGSLVVPFTIRGMQLAVSVERRGSRIYATLAVPTKLMGLIELTVGVEEAPIRAALERAASSELARAASAFFINGQAGAIDQLAANVDQLISDDVLGLAGDVAMQDLAQQAMQVLGAYGNASVGADMLPGPADVGAYDRTFMGEEPFPLAPAYGVPGTPGTWPSQHYGLGPPYRR